MLFLPLDHQELSAALCTLPFLLNLFLRQIAIYSMQRRLLSHHELRLVKHPVCLQTEFKNKIKKEIFIKMDKNQLKVQKQLYGQLVIGPPGSGKSTYCAKIASFYKQINRKFSIVNLDPANENIQYEPEIDIMTLINVEQVMERHNLGPNGALIYCMEYLELNFHWFLHKLQRSSSNYFLFDCPGEWCFSAFSISFTVLFHISQVKLNSTLIINRCETCSRSCRILVTISALCIWSIHIIAASHTNSSQLLFCHSTRCYRWDFHTSMF